MNMLHQADEPGHIQKRDHQNNALKLKEFDNVAKINQIVNSKVRLKNEHNNIFFLMVFMYIKSIIIS
jgi:hypothetical protein